MGCAKMKLECPICGTLTATVDVSPAADERDLGRIRKFILDAHLASAHSKRRQKKRVLA